MITKTATYKEQPTFFGMDYVKKSVAGKVRINYSTFGSQMPGRSYNSGDYRHGFNGMEKDDEIKGSGNSYDFGARMYDPRIGRWFSTDPKTFFFPSMNPYNFAGNSPVTLSDPDGGEQTIYLYIHPSYFSGTELKTLSSAQIKEIVAKVQVAMDKSGLSQHFNLVAVNSPMEKEFMDDTDVSAIISDHVELNTEVSKLVNEGKAYAYRPNIMSDARGKTPIFSRITSSSFFPFWRF